MGYESCNPASIVIKGTSFYERKQFDRKYEHIIRDINNSRMSIADFCSSPLKGINFILNESFQDFETGEVSTRYYRTVEERMAADANAEKHMVDEVQPQDPSNRQSKALEYIIGAFVRTGNLLGTRADSRATTSFDDAHNKVDEIVTFEGLEKGTSPFGIDVTIATNKAIIRDKLAKPHNSPATQLPAGCSRVIYYEHRGIKQSLPAVPRYVVALSGGFVESIVRSDIQISPAGKPEVVNRNSPRMLLVRQRILSELYAQAKLRFEQLNKIPDSNRSYQENRSRIDFRDQMIIFDQALAGVEKAIADQNPSLKNVDAEQVRAELIRRSEDSDPAYAALMQEVSTPNRKTTSQRIGQATLAVAWRNSG